MDLNSCTALSSPNHFGKLFSTTAFSGESLQKNYSKTFHDSLPSNPAPEIWLEKGLLLLQSVYKIPLPWQHPAVSDCWLWQIEPPLWPCEVGNEVLCPVTAWSGSQYWCRIVKKSGFGSVTLPAIFETSIRWEKWAARSYFLRRTFYYAEMDLNFRL